MTLLRVFQGPSLPQKVTRPLLQLPDLYSFFMNDSINILIIGVSILEFYAAVVLPISVRSAWIIRASLTVTRRPAIVKLVVESELVSRPIV